MNPIQTLFCSVAVTALCAWLPFSVARGGEAETSMQRKTCIDRDWRFQLGDGSAVLTHPSVSAQWRLLDLPHDWSVEPEAARLAGGTVVGPFSTNSIGKYQTGHTVGGTGWYVKTLSLTADALADACHVLYFEGAYNQTEVFVNGQRVGENLYGYSSFRFDVTRFLHAGDNTVAVKVANEGNNTRWYAGSGIYRHVWLLRTPQWHLDEWDTYVQADPQQVTLSLGLLNETQKARRGKLSVEVLNAQGELVTSASMDVKAKKSEHLPVELSLPWTNPQPWSPDSPYRYRAVIRLTDTKTGQTDRLVKTFGMRTLEFTTDRGFLLNGQPTLLQGGCVHHDNGLLGAAAYDDAETRKLALLKAQGFNAVRCSHNLPSEHFLDACDSLGLLVIDEAFDQWLRKKNVDDYHRYFDQHCEDDLSVMLRRDRNHPSIIMWSIGNEIPGRIEPAGVAVAERLRQTVKRYDTSRPVTAAICGWDEGDGWNSAGHNWELQDSLAFRSLDVGAYNYLLQLYERDHKTHPDRVMVGAESFPKLASQNWNQVERLPYVVGDFVWTAMDYLGEAGIGSAAIRKEGNQTMFQDWPWYNGWCGDIDICGQKKPQSYYRDIVWRRAPITMGVERPVPEGMHQSVSMWGWQLEQQCWTYPDQPEGAPMRVNVYSRSPRVRLYLNDQLVGEEATSDTYTATFTVPYQTGTLRAVTFDGSREGDFFTLQTTTAPVALRLTPDRQQMTADGTSLCYVTVELVDAQGRVVTSDTTTTVQLSAAGSGTLLAAGNASPTDMESFRSVMPRLFGGRALAILKSGRTPGTLTLTAQADALPQTQATVTVSQP